MLRNYFFVNLVLVIIITFLGIELYKVFAYSVDIPSGPEIQTEEKSVTDNKRKEAALHEGSFQIISNMNLFSPARSAPLIKKDKTAKAGPKNAPRLFGTIILNSIRTAILEDPDTKTTKTYRVNESVAGFVISEILEDKVVLLSDGEKVEVRLREDKGIKTSTRTTSRVRPRQQPRRTRPTPRNNPRPRRIPRKPSPGNDATNTAPHSQTGLPEEVQNIVEQRGMEPDQLQ